MKQAFASTVFLAALCLSVLRPAAAQQPPAAAKSDAYEAILEIQGRCFALQKQKRLADEAACYDQIVNLARRTDVLDAEDVEHYRTIAAQLRDAKLDKGAALRCTHLSWIYRASCRVGQNDIESYERAACINRAIQVFSNNDSETGSVDDSPCRGDQRESIVKEWLATYDDFVRKTATDNSEVTPPPAPQSCLKIGPAQSSQVPCKPGATWVYTHVESVRGRDCPRQIGFRFENPEDRRQEDWSTPFDIQTCGAAPRYIRTR
jgi:hypothetical protein